jgi:Flp pilus assembly protein TadG
MKAALSGERGVTRGTSIGAHPTSRFHLDSKTLIGEEGTDLVEFAIVFLLLMTLLFGIAGFGHALYAYHFVSNMAREATRWAAVNGSTCATDSSCTAPATPTDITTFVTNHTPLGIDPKQITVTPTWNPAGSNGPTTCSTTSNAPGCTVEVQVSYNFQFIFPLIQTGVLPLSSSSEMVISH